jgi:hypothetical protein
MTMSLVGYYKMTSDRMRALAFEQYAPTEAQVSRFYDSLSMNVSLEMARHDMFHPRLSVVAQLL